MSAKKKTQKQPINLKKRRAMLLALSLVGVALVIFAAWWMVMRSNMSTQARMTKYLEDKYGKEFVVGKPELKANGLGVKGFYSATAYAKSSKYTSTFTVSCSLSGCWDGYVAVTWQQQEDLSVRDELKRVFLYVPKYRLSIGSPDVEKSIAGQIPSFSETVQKYGKVINYSLRIDDKSKSQTDAIDYTNALIGYLNKKNVNVSYGYVFDKGYISIQQSDLDNLTTGRAKLEQYITLNKEMD